MDNTLKNSLKKLHTVSKIIKKRAVTIATRYVTTPTEVKKVFLYGLRIALLPDLTPAEELSCNTNFDLTHEIKDRLTQRLQTIPTKELTVVLVALLRTVLPEIKIGTDTLKVWRKRVKEWVSTTPIVETRGAPNFPLAQNSVYYQCIIAIIRNCKYRKFAVLRLCLCALFELVEKSQNAGHLDGLPPLSTTCNKKFTKTWWATINRRFPEVRDHWKALPIRRVHQARQRAPLTYSEVIDSQAMVMQVIQILTLQYVSFAEERTTALEQIDRCTQRFELLKRWFEEILEAWVTPIFQARKD